MKTAAADLSAEIAQSSADKLTGSVSYPLRVLEHRKDFPGCTRLASSSESGFYEYSKDEIEAMLKGAVSHIRARTHGSEVSVQSQIYSFAGSIVEQARKVLEIATTASDYEGPDKSELNAVVDGGIENLVNTLGDFGIYAWNPYLRVTVKKRPSIGLQSPRIDLSGISIEVVATGELWAKYPWWNCYKWCTKWEKIHKCDRVASLTVSPDIAANAHAVVQTSGARVLVQAEFDKLRLDYDILRKIPLEGVANSALRGKSLFVYDASQLIATVPVLQSRFAVDEILLPPNSGGISVGVALRQI
jgi:hypothetical protein